VLFVRVLVLALVMVGAVVRAAPLAAQSSDAHMANIERALRDAEAEGMNGVILIRAQNRVLLHEAYGALDREAGRAMTVDAGFDIGSLVKAITAVAVFRLEELGEISVADPLSMYFPGAPPDKANLTIWQLLTHTAGLPDIFGSDYDLVSRDWVLDQALSAPLLGPPGVEERYSNVGYSLLAMIIEDASGLSFEEFVRAEVLIPAETPDIGYVLAGWNNDALAVGYRRGQRWGTPLDHPWANDGPGWNLRGNGGMLGSVESMGRWYEALFDGAIIGTEAAARYYGFDAGQSRAVSGLALSHAGGNGIFNTLQISWVDHDVHLTFFTSSSRPLNAETVWEEISEDVVAIARLVASR